MEINSNIRKIAELGVGMTAIATLVLAGCGGGGGGVSGGSSTAPGTVMNVTPALGQFKETATVTVSDKFGNVIDKEPVNASGVAAVTIPASAVGPFLIGAGVNGDQYFNEKTGSLATISGVVAGRTAIHAVIPNSAASSVGVTPLTEMAAALVTTSGVLSPGVTVSSVNGANVTIAANIASKFGFSANTSILTPPTPVAASLKVLGDTDADKYAKVLHTLANLANYGADPLEIARNMRDDAADGKFDGIIGTGTASAVTRTTTLDNDVANATTTASHEYTGTAPTVAHIDNTLDLKEARKAAEVEDEATAERAATIFGNVFATSGVAAATTAAASAVATAEPR